MIVIIMIMCYFAPLIINRPQHIRRSSRQNINKLHVAIGTCNMKRTLASVVALAWVASQDVDEEQCCFVRASCRHADESRVSWRWGDAKVR